MAYLPHEKLASIIEEKGLAGYTNNTITDRKDLEIELEKIRRQGYAVDNIEHEKGVRCVAAPIKDYSGKVIASMSVSGPAFRIDEGNIPIIAAKVKECCDCISEEMGYSF